MKFTHVYNTVIGYHMPRTVTLLIALATLSGTAVAESLSIADREQAIYTAIINHGAQGDVSMVVLAGNTTGDPAAITEQTHADAVVADLEVPHETLRDWQQRNRRISPIEYSLNVNASYQLMDRKTHRDLFKGGEPEAGWQAFFNRYPGAPGLLRVSHAGFDHSLTHALVYAEFQCGAECGSGRLIHLETDGANTWSVRGSALVWIVD